MKQEIWVKAVIGSTFYIGQRQDRVIVSFENFEYTFRFRYVKNAKHFQENVQGRYVSGKEAIQKLRKTFDESQGEDHVFMFFSSLMEND
jgi:hypothetical protein